MPVDADTATCLNCGEPMRGCYCAECGQKDIGERLDLKIFMATFMEALTEFDGRLWRSLRELVRNPGQVAVNYIGGARASYINPVRLFIASFAVYVGLGALTGSQDIIAQGAIFLDGDYADRELAELISDAVITTISSQFDLVIFLTVPLFALVIRWQYWWANRNYVEVLCFILMVFGIGYLLAIPVSLVQHAIEQYSSVPKNVIIGYFFLIGARTFFALTWPAAVVMASLSGLFYAGISIGMVTAIAGVRVLFGNL